jgi:hypothetical protein
VNTKKKSDKPFDCITSKRKAQSRIHRKIKGMTAEDEIAYFDRAVRTGPFAQMWEGLVKKGRKARTSGRSTSPARRTA